MTTTARAISELIPPEDLVHCERFRATISRKVCKARKKKALDLRSGAPVDVRMEYAECLKCNKQFNKIKGVKRMGKLEETQQDHHQKKDAVMCSKCGERPASLRSDGAVLNGLCGKCNRGNLTGGKRLKQAQKEDTISISITEMERLRPGLFDQLKEMAAQDMRTIALEIMWYIDRAVEKTHT